MKHFKNLKISVKMLVGFIIVAIIAGIVGTIGITNINIVNKEYTDLFNEYGKPLNNLGDVMSLYQRTRVNLREIILNVGQDSTTYIDKINSYNQDIDTNINELETAIKSDDLLSQIEQIKSDFVEYRTFEDSIKKAALSGDAATAIDTMHGDAYTVASKIDKELNQLQTDLVNGGNEISANLSKTTGTTEITLIIIVFLAMIAAIALGLFISRLISKPIKELVVSANKLAIGDINVNVEANTKDEIGTLMIAFSRMIANIREQAMATEKLAAGNFDIELKVKSENDLLNKKLSEMVQIIKSVISEVGNLSSSAVEGQLSVRGDEKKFKGEFSNIIKGINNTLDAVLQPINEASEVLEEMSKGNLLIAVEGNYKGDHATIKNAINNTLASFNEILGNINSAAEQVASGSKQISVSSITLSQGSTEQASSIEEITASIEQITSQTNLNATNADTANGLATAVKEKAVQGNSQMSEMLKAMAEINDSSNSISKIIKVIDDIAFQTNILALNAAVEAARAGQHGKGFAVVAEEVRNLAARSANAAKETTSMIEGSIKKVETGTKIANETAIALNQIVEGIAKAADLVSDIATASNEQASGTAQISQAISQVSQVVQENSATSEESAAASEELSGQAELLKELINKYKFKKSSENRINSELLSPDIINMLEKIAATKNIKPSEPIQTHTSSKIKISLDDKEFGKY